VRIALLFQLATSCTALRLQPRGRARSFGRIRLISHGLSANEQYFSLTPNQPIVLSTMTYQPNKPKQTGRIFLYAGGAPCLVIRPA